MAKDISSFDVWSQPEAFDAVPALQTPYAHATPSAGSQNPSLRELLACTLEKRLQLIEHILCAS